MTTALVNFYLRNPRFAWPYRSENVLRALADLKTSTPRIGQNILFIGRFPHLHSTFECCYVNKTAYNQPIHHPSIHWMTTLFLTYEVLHQSSRTSMRSTERRGEISTCFCSTCLVSKIGAPTEAIERQP